MQYESVYGEDFVSPGGREMALELIGRMARGLQLEALHDPGMLKAKV